MEAFRIGEQSNVRARGLTWAILLAFAVGIPATFVIYAALSYQYGALNQSELVGMGREGFNRLQSWLAYPLGPDLTETAHIGLGAAITALLLAMKMRYLWWPFHPIGYVLGMSHDEMVYIWVPVLISWSLKLGILKYGGLRAYRRGIPFFAGLILGDYTLGCLWSFYNAATGQMTYNMGWHPIMWWK